jgi:hypothetical protein
MSLTSKTYISRNVYSIHIFYHAESARRKISYAQQMALTAEAMKELY